MKELNILIVDDEILIAEFYKDSIDDYLNKEFKINFHYQPDGQFALDLTFEEEFDLIISDIKMPLMSGDEFIKKVQTDGNKNRATPIIIVSAYPDINFGQKNLVYIMKKPVNVQRLEKICKLALANHYIEVQNSA